MRGTEWYWKLYPTSITSTLTPAGARTLRMNCSHPAICGRPSVPQKPGISVWNARTAGWVAAGRVAVARRSECRPGGQEDRRSQQDGLALSMLHQWTLNQPPVERWHEETRHQQRQIRPG